MGRVPCVRWVTVMVLSVFGDESADETSERVFAISGLFGAEDEWRAAEESWLALTKGEVFHAADWERNGRKDEYKQLALALAASPVAGVAYAIDLVGFRAVYPETLREAPYLKCFARLIKDAAWNAEVFNASVPPPQNISKLEFTFDNRRETKYSAARLYSNMLEEPNWSPSALLASKVSFECRTNPRIQMADMIARECMKDLDRQVGPTKFRERLSKVELGRNNHFRFFALRREDFTRERESFAALEKDGFSEAAYGEWLREKGAQDTWDSRSLFHEVFDGWKSRR